MKQVQHQFVCHIKEDCIKSCYIQKVCKYFKTFLRNEALQILFEAIIGFHNFIFQLTWLPRDRKIRCYCRNVRELTFGNSFYAAPNSIDFSTVFLKFSPLSQAAVIGTLASIAVVYILAVIFLRRKDQKDVLKVLFKYFLTFEECNKGICIHCCFRTVVYTV